MGTSVVSTDSSDPKKPSYIFPDMAKNAQGASSVSKPGTKNTYNLTYTLDFQNPASWSVFFLDQPHFQGQPCPSFHEGESVDELIHQAPLIQDSLSSPNVKQLTQINNSPELKSHSKLDEFALALGNDPMVIANYVQNKIELTDAIGYNCSGAVDPNSVNPQGMCRDALATYLEGQGSAIEQCALLIYLLRKAGYPAAYVFPEQNKTLMFDEQLSKMLHMQLRGAMSLSGPMKLPELIPVNYPWVAFYYQDKNNTQDKGKWVHLFPWIKDTEAIEGKNIWDYFPNNYKNERQWLMGYLLNDPAIRSLSSEDNIGTLFPLYAQQQLNSKLSIDDIGIHYLNRQHDYSDWNDFPRPWTTPFISNDHITPNLDSSSPEQNPKLLDKVSNIFDTISIQVISDRSNKGISDLSNPTLLDTGSLRLVDLHDRRFLFYHQVIPNSNPTAYNLRGCTR